ncbi:MAG: GGDEF domain-containing protein, partial [Myxococcota bacterium]
LGLAMVDLDHFKRVNDTFGHAAGDAVLREATQRVRAVLRPYDRLGRLGGEEFLLVLPDCDRDALRSIAERVRVAISEAPFQAGAAHIAVTCSVGVGTVLQPGDALPMINRADIALYEAKSGGRNRVIEVP